MSSFAVPAQEAARKSWKRWIPWAGWAVSLWPVFVVALSANWKLTRNAWYVAEFDRIGWPDSVLPLLAFLQLGAIALFLTPRTAVLGAILDGLAQVGRKQGCPPDAQYKSRTERWAWLEESSVRKPQVRRVLIPSNWDCRGCLLPSR